MNDNNNSRLIIGKNQCGISRMFTKITYGKGNIQAYMD